MGWASCHINLKIIRETYSSTYTWCKTKRAPQKSQNQSNRKQRLFRKHKDLALMRWSMFKHTLPVCQAGSDTLSWALCERGHATLSVFHTHMHTHNNGCLGLCFHGNLCQQSSHGSRRTCGKMLQGSAYVCVCVSVCDHYLVPWRAQMFRHSPGSFLSWPLLTCPHASPHRHTPKSAFQIFGGDLLAVLNSHFIFSFGITVP